MDEPVTGTVAGLWRFPVKSMLGEDIQSAAVTDRGVLGDRAYGLVDREDGKVASAKNPRKWRTLLECRASFVDDPVPGHAPPPARIDLPDGRQVRTDDPDIDVVLSALTGRNVTLQTVAPDDRTLEEYWPDVDGLAPQEFLESTRIETDRQDDVVTDVAMGLISPPETFFDLATLHLVTTSTLRELERLAPDVTWDARRFRPNLVVETRGDEFVENGWPGRTLALGERLEIQVSIPTPRCVMTTMAQPGFDEDRGVLRAVADHNRLDVGGVGQFACAGVYADVTEPGPVRVGDPVALVAD